jgi:hypothetical protein
MSSTPRAGARSPQRVRVGGGSAWRRWRSRSARASSCSTMMGSSGFYELGRETMKFSTEKNTTHLSSYGGLLGLTEPGRFAGGLRDRWHERGRGRPTICDFTCRNDRRSLQRIYYRRYERHRAETGLHVAACFMRLNNNRICSERLQPPRALHRVSRSPYLNPSAITVDRCGKLLSRAQFLGNRGSFALVANGRWRERSSRFGTRVGEQLLLESLPC